MAENNEVKFYVGNIEVCVNIEDGQASMTGTGPNGEIYECEVVFLRLSAGKCLICRKLHGVWTCEDIACSVVDMQPSSEMKS